MSQKKLFQLIFALLAVSLMLLPFFVSFNNLLTQFVEKNRMYGWVQKRVVPVETRMVGTLVKPFGVDVKIVRKDILVVNGRRAKVTWNCLGWQSFLLFLITLVFGLRGSRYTLSSKIETAVIGAISLYLINMLRMTLTVLLLAYARSIFKIVFHDYLAALVTIVFLLAFWWFAYRYVLEEKRPFGEEETIKV